MTHTTPAIIKVAKEEEIPRVGEKALKKLYSLSAPAF
jgi:hypothetical protein